MYVVIHRRHSTVTWQVSHEFKFNLNPPDQGWGHPTQLEADTTTAPPVVLVPDTEE
jgi:hypothetical protein